MINTTTIAGCLQPAMNKYVVVRSPNAGVHAGVLVAADTNRGQTLVLEKARRLWRWQAGESISLSAVARHGVQVPKDGQPDPNRVGGELPFMVIAGWCEILPCTDKARKSIQYAPEAPQEK